MPSPKLSDKQVMALWEEFRDNLVKSTPVDHTETTKQQKARIKRLEADDEAWFAYYFPNFYSAEPARFHKAATKRIMTNPEWYEIRAWSRELAKSTRSMMEDLKLLVTKKKRYKLLISNSFDNACRLLKPYIINLESNGRLINDYGRQEKLGAWTEGDITSRMGFSIRAIGAGQSPRGTRKDELRPDIIEFDDFDTDEECENKDIIDKKWRWVNDAAISTRSVSKDTLIRWNGNFIAEDCCIVRAQEYADKVDVVNIRDANGKSTWPAKNTEERIDRVLSLIPLSTQQKEYYNTPYTEGRVFKEMRWGKCLSIKQSKFVVIYADPATSNNDKPSKKSKAQNSTKAVFVLNFSGPTRYVQYGFLGHVSNDTFVDWLYAAYDWVKEDVPIYLYIENNSLQDPFYQQVLKPLIKEKGKKRGAVLSHHLDARKKPDKFLRIEGTLEPLNRMGNLILNEKEKSNPHMKLLEQQFKSVSPNSKTMDGPDAVEGGVWIIDNKVLETAPMSLGVRKSNSKRY